MSIQLINLDDNALTLLGGDLPQFERTYHALAGEYAALLHSLADQAYRLLEHNRWGAYVAVDKTAGQIVGTCAFKSSPSVDGEVEIAYFTFEEFEGRGYGTAMAQALIGMARGKPEVRRITAHTLPEPGASPRILEKVGMTFEGQVHDPIDGVVWRWSMTTDHRRYRSPDKE